MSDESKQGTVVPKDGPQSAQDDVKYESAIKPLLWLLIPFVIVLVYAAMSN